MLGEIKQLISYHSRFSARFAKHDCHNVFEKAVRDLRAAGCKDIAGKRVLDLGCGQRYPFALQCAASGAVATALDIDHVEPNPWPLAFYHTTRHNGLKRASKSLLRHLLFDGNYYGRLESEAGRSLCDWQRQISFVLTDPTCASYPLPAGSFDVIASNAVVEHVADVGRFASEVSRLLVSGGYFYAIIHNYYSLSGGHNLEWAYPDEHPSSDIPPWDHLRENRFPAWSHLNRLLPDQYLEAFGRELKVALFEGRDVNHDPWNLEGEKLLTPEIAAELAAYPRDLLLTRAWCLICKKSA